MEDPKENDFLLEVCLDFIGWLAAGIWKMSEITKYQFEADSVFQSQIAHKFFCLYQYKTYLQGEKLGLHLESVGYQIEK